MKVLPACSVLLLALGKLAIRRTYTQAAIFISIVTMAGLSGCY